MAWILALTASTGSPARTHRASVLPLGLFTKITKSCLSLRATPDTMPPVMPISVPGTAMNRSPETTRERTRRNGRPTCSEAMCSEATAVAQCTPPHRSQNSSNPVLELDAPWWSESSPPSDAALPRAAVPVRSVKAARTVAPYRSQAHQSPRTTVAAVMPWCSTAVATASGGIRASIARMWLSKAPVQARKHGSQAHQSPRTTTTTVVRWLSACRLLVRTAAATMQTATIRAIIARPSKAKEAKKTRPKKATKA